MFPINFNRPEVAVVDVATCKAAEVNGTALLVPSKYTVLLNTFTFVFVPVDANIKPRTRADPAVTALDPAGALMSPITLLKML